MEVDELAEHSRQCVRLRKIERAVFENRNVS